MRMRKLSRALLGTLVAVVTFGGLSSVSAATVPSTTDPNGNPVTRASAMPPHRYGFDNAAVDSPATLACLHSGHYTFDMIDMNQDVTSQTRATRTGWGTEYVNAGAAGLQVVLFQGYYQPYWTSVNAGTIRGRVAAANARAIGYPSDAEIFLDVENNLNANEGTAEAWVHNWTTAVRAAGYRPGVYAGVPQRLTAADLDTKIAPTAAFWKSYSRSAPQTKNGYVVTQTGVGTHLCGATVDTDLSGYAANQSVMVAAAFH